MIVQKKHQLEEERTMLSSQKSKLQTFMDSVEAMPDELKRFSTERFLNTTDHIEVEQTHLVYHLYGGEKKKISITEIRKKCF